MHDAKLSSPAVTRAKSESKPKTKTGLVGLSLHCALALALVFLVPLLSPRIAIFGVMAYVPVMMWVALSGLMVLGSLMTRRKTWWIHFGLLSVVALFGTGFNIPLGAVSEKEQLKVATLNVLRGKTDLEKLTAWVKSEGITVIALQETNRENGSDFGEDLARRLGGWNVVFAGETALVSRHAFVRSGREQIAAKYPRYLVWADLEVDGQQVRMICGHWTIPQFSGNPLHLPNRVAHADKQKVDATQKSLALVNEASGQVVFMGDLNTPPTHGFYRAVDRELDNVWALAGLGWGTTYGGGKPLGRIDHIWVSDGIRPNQVHVGDGFGSDHKSLQAGLVLNAD